jgi:hypothetical protein
MVFQNNQCKVSCGDGYKDEYIFGDPRLEVCIFIVNQEQTFEVVFQMKINSWWSKTKLNVAWVSDEEINRDD